MRGRGQREVKKDWEESEKKRTERQRKKRKG